MFKKIIFDFDGTLANTLEAIVHIANQFSEEFGYEEISNLDFKQLQKLESKDIIKTSNIPLIKIPILLQVVKKELNDYIENIKPIDGIDEALRTLTDRGYQLGIVSSNSETNIHHFIKHNNWEELFEIICCGTTIFGKAKVLRKLMTHQNLSVADVIYVGDETRDIDAAKQVNIPAIAVTWGFNSRSILAGHHPDFLIDRPEEIIDIITNL